MAWGESAVLARENRGLMGGDGDRITRAPAPIGLTWLKPYGKTAQAEFITYRENAQ